MYKEYFPGSIPVIVLNKCSCVLAKINAEELTFRGKWQRFQPLAAMEKYMLFAITD